MNHPLQEHMMSNHRQKTFQAITIGILSGELPTHEKLKNLREREAGNSLPANK